MSKGKYSAVDFQGWFFEEEYRRFDGRELVVGIDAAKIAFYAVVMTSGWQDYDLLYFERDDLAEFIAKLNQLDFDQITLVVEPTGTYAEPLLDQARQAGFEVRRINGSQVKNAASVFDDVPSLHDGKAAYLLGRLHLCGVGSEWEATSEQDRDLRALAELDQLVEKSQQMFVGPLESRLAKYWPGVTELLGLTSATLLELIAEFGCPSEVADRPEQAEALMRRVGGNFLSDDKIEAVLASAADSVGVEPSRLEKHVLEFVAGTLRQAQKGGRKVRREVERAASEDERCQELVEFAGKRTALTFVAFLGSLRGYEAPGQLEKAFGMNLCERTTGKTKQDKREELKGLHISKRGPARARVMLYFLALRMINPQSTSYCPICTAWYAERMRRNGGDTMKSLVALMRKLIDALWWVARGKSFDATKLFDVERLQKLGHLQPAQAAM